MNEKLNLSVTVAEANLLFQALGSQPYIQVVDLISNLNNQLQQQISASKKEAE
jgi:hypothetical protein